METADVAILGGGLAGVLLAHAIEELGGSVVVADQARPNAASPMAPGIINPLAGRRFTVNTDYAATFSTTMAFFASLEERFRRPLWHPTKLIRLLENADQTTYLEARRNNPTEAIWLGESFPAGAHGACVHDPAGSFETLQGGWFDVPELIRAAREQGGFRFIDPVELDASAPITVDCRGWRCSQDPHWAHFPWRCARGEVMTVTLDGDLPRHLWNGGGWLQPLPDGNWRAGATYGWSLFEAPPMLTAQAELMGKLRRWLRVPFRIIDQQVGVRAVVLDYRPVLGALPNHPNRHIFSGLGSHGAIQGPPFARLLAQHLLEGSPLSADVDAARFAPH